MSNPVASFCQFLSKTQKMSKTLFWHCVNLLELQYESYTVRPCSYGQITIVGYGIRIIFRLNSVNFQNFHFEVKIDFLGKITKTITRVNSRFSRIHPVYELW